MTQVFSIDADQVAEEWSCPQCTYINSDLDTICQICQCAAPTCDVAELVRSEVERRIDWTQFVCDLRIDINNQAEDAERLISQKCLIDWAAQQSDVQNPTVSAHDIYYDYRPQEEFEQGEQPNAGDNEYKPFLSKTVLESILVTELEILSHEE